MEQDRQRGCIREMTNNILFHCHNSHIQIQNDPTLSEKKKIYIFLRSISQQWKACHSYGIGLFLFHVHIALC